MNPMILKLLMNVIQQLGTRSPNQPANGAPMNLPAMGIPQSARGPTPEENQINQIISLVQSLQPASQQRGLNGFQGGPYGSMGGRPPGS